MDKVCRRELTTVSFLRHSTYTHGYYPVSPLQARP